MGVCFFLGFRWKVSDKVCSIHFIEADFKRTGKSKTLKPNAVPNTFPTSIKHLRQLHTERPNYPENTKKQGTFFFFIESSVRTIYVHTV